MTFKKTGSSRQSFRILHQEKFEAFASPLTSERHGEFIVRVFAPSLFTCLVQVPFIYHRDRRFLIISILLLYLAVILSSIAAGV